MFTNIWTALGHFYKKNFFTAIKKKKLFAIIKKRSSQL